MAELFKNKKLMKKKGDKFETVDGEKILRNKVVVLYFSAHWCPPCRQFTPVLKNFYEEANRIKKNCFEVVFVSADRSEAELTTYLNELHGDWCFLAFNDTFKSELSEKYDVAGIPAVILIKANGEAVETNCAQGIRGHPSAVLKEWAAKSGVKTGRCSLL